MRSWRWLLPAVAITALSAVAACDTPVGPGAPVSQPSEVTGRVWFCTPSQVQGQPGEDKASDSAVTLEIVTAASSGASDSKRFPRTRSWVGRQRTATNGGRPAVA